jgi:hypothetical protein
MMTSASVARIRVTRVAALHTWLQAPASTAGRFYFSKFIKMTVTP